MIRTDRQAPRAVRLADYTPYPWRIDEVRLDIRLDPATTRVRTELDIAPAGTGPSAALVLDGEAIELIGIAIDGAELTDGDYELDAATLTILRPPARPFRLKIESRCNPQDNTELSGLYLTNGIYCTQCEAEGFRRIGFFPDRPDVLSRYEVRVEGPEELTALLSNGNCVASGAAGPGRHFALWRDPFPKPSYLFALVAG
ncbi:MAG TPA: aminopeptidase N, partial [Rhodobacteraceae bacterium]|nr:aminopeptidase N [Paracoccaceae bacterium]